MGGGGCADVDSSGFDVGGVDAENNLMCMMACLSR
jgi:hypothetical protein